MVFARIWGWLTSETGGERATKLADLADSQESVVQAATDLKDMAETMCTAVADVIDTEP